MPGLIGLITFKEPLKPVWLTVNKMAEFMKHEDYYVVDKKVNSNIGIGAIDLNKGDFISKVIEDDSYILGFTGQIYDQEVLVEKISGDGKQPIDLPNLLLNIYKRYGPEKLSGLNGLYVVVIWDKESKKLHIVNDRYGFRKLYYWNSHDKFVFASEYKAICWFPDFQKKVDEFAFANLMTFGYVLDDRTLFEDIKMLPPASIATVEKGKLSITKYWDYSFYEEGDPRLRKDEYIDAFAEKITKAVKKRVKGIKRLALALSGGLDSRTMAAILHKLNMVDYIKAYSHGNRHCYDVRFGKKIAKKLGFPHETIEIKTDFVKNHARNFQYLSEGTAACDWAWRIDSQKGILLKDKIDTVLTGFLGDVLCRLYMSEKGLLRKNNEDAIQRVYQTHMDSFNDDELEQYLNPNIYAKIKGHNLEIIKETYYNAPTANILNRARYINLHQRQRRFTSTLLDHYEFFANALSPFIDNEFVDFILHIPAELQVKQSLYKSMLKRHFPDVVKIGHSDTGIPIKPSWWQAGLKWRKESYLPLFEKLSFNLYIRHDYQEYRNTPLALRTASRQFMLDVFKNEAIKQAFFNVEKFDDLVKEFLQSKSNEYEKVCYPLTFFIWADVFQSGNL